MADPFEEELLRELGLLPEQEPSLWRRVTTPVRTIFGATQGVGGKLGELAFGEEAYRRAKEANLEAAGEPLEDTPWYEETAALPGLGDVAAEMLPTEFRESTPGRILEPVGKIVGNIIGDPTTYTPLVAKNVGSALVRSVPAAEKVVQELNAARQLGQAVDEAPYFARMWQAMEEAGPIKANAFKLAESLDQADNAMAAAAGVVYGPDVLTGAWESAKAAFGAETFNEALVGGANTALMAGLGILMGKGMLSVKDAQAVLANKVAQDLAAGTKTAQVINGQAAAEQQVADEYRATGAAEPRLPLGPMPEFPVDETPINPPTFSGASWMEDLVGPRLPLDTEQPVSYDDLRALEPDVKNAATEAPLPLRDVPQGWMNESAAPLSYDELRSMAADTASATPRIPVNIPKPSGFRGTVDWTSETAPVKTNVEAVAAAPETPTVTAKKGKKATKKTKKAKQPEVTPTTRTNAAGESQTLVDLSLDDPQLTYGWQGNPLKDAESKAKAEEYSKLTTEPEPIEVIRRPNGELEIFEGHHRVAATKLGNKKSIKAWVYDKPKEVTPKEATFYKGAPDRVAEPAVDESAVTKAEPGETSQVVTDQQVTDTVTTAPKSTITTAPEAPPKETIPGRSETPQAATPTKTEGELPEARAMRHRWSRWSPDEQAAAKQALDNGELSARTDDTLKVGNETDRQKAAYVAVDKFIKELREKNKAKETPTTAPATTDATTTTTAPVKGKKAQSYDPAVLANKQGADLGALSASVESGGDVVDQTRRLLRKKVEDSDSKLDNDTATEVLFNDLIDKFKQKYGPSAERPHGHQTPNGSLNAVRIDPVLEYLKIRTLTGMDKKQARELFTKSVNAHRNFPAHVDKLWANFVNEQLGTGVADVKATPDVIAQLTKEKEAVSKALKTRTGDVKPEDFVASLNKDEVQGALENYARWSGKAGAAAGLPTSLRSNDRLTEFAKDIGLEVKPKTNFEKLTKAISKTLGLDHDAIMSAYRQEQGKTKTARVAAAVTPAGKKSTKFEAPEGFKPKAGTNEYVSDGVSANFLSGKTSGKYDVHITPLEKGEPLAIENDLRTLIGHPDVETITLPKGAKGKKAFDAVSTLVEEGKLAYDDNFNGRLIVLKGDDPKVAERVAVRKGKATSELSLPERRLRAYQYARDAETALQTENGHTVVNFDRHQFPTTYKNRVVDLATKPAVALGRVVDDLVKKVNAALGTKNTAKFKGITLSPYQAGLYHEVGDEANIYANLVEAVHAAPDYDSSIDALVDTLIHEVSHNGGLDHDHRFVSRYDELRALAQADNMRDEYRKWIKEAFSEEDYKAVKNELVPEFRKAQEVIDGESWRKHSRQDLQTNAAREAEGGASAKANRDLGSAASAVDDSSGRVQPGRAVAGGTENAPGELRSASDAAGTAAKRNATGEAVGSPVGRIAGQAARHSEEEAKRLIDDLIRLGDTTGKMSTDRMLDEAWNIADWYVSNAPQDRIDYWANSKPAPRGKGESEGPINVTHMVDFGNDPASKLFKAKLNFVYHHTRGHWNRDHPISFQEMDAAARKILDFETEESFILAQKRSGKGVTAAENRLFSIIHHNLAANFHDIEQRYFSSVDQPKAVQDALREEYNQAKWRYFSTVNTIADKRSGLGRALGIVRMDTMRDDPRAMMESRLFAGLLEKLRTREKDKVVAEEKARKLLQQFREVFENGGSVDEFRKAYRMAMQKGVWPEKAIEWYKMGLLGWPSQVANTASNTLMGVTRQIENVVAGMLDAGRVALGMGPKERKVFASEGALTLLAIKRAAAEGWGAYSQSVKDSFLLKPGDMQQMLKQGALTEDLFHMTGAIEGRLGEFIRFHGKMMTASDAYAKVFSATNDLYKQIYREVRNKNANFPMRPNESAVAATERYASEARTLHSQAIQALPHDTKRLRIYEPMLKKAEQVAKEETFQQDLPDWMRGFHSLVQRSPILQVLFPFVRTPTNIARQTIERTPFGYYIAAKNWSKTAAKDRNIADLMTDLAKPTTGSLLMAAFAAVAGSGVVTGGGPVDFDAQDALKATGWQPYSIKLGNQWLSYQRLEPVSSIIGFAADMVEAAQRGETATVRDVVEKGMNSIADNLTNKTFLENMDKAFAAISRPQQYGPQFMKQIQASLLPNSVGFVPVGHLARAIDPVYRQTEPLTADVFKAKIPGLSTSVAPQYGPTGDMRLRPGTAPERLLSPFARQTQDTGPKWVGANEMVRTDAVPKTPMKFWVSPEGYKVYLKPEERQLLAKAMQDFTYNLGSKVVNDKGYRGLPTNEMDPNYRFGMMTKQEYIKKMVDKYRDRAFKQILPELRKRAYQQYRERA